MELGTDVRLNSVEADPRSVEETLDLQQGKLVLGFRLGDCMEDPSAEELAAIRVFNECYGGSVTSRLFKMSGRNSPCAITPAPCWKSIRV